MLAAVPTNEDRALAMVQLALKLATEGHELPLQLRSYFYQVVKQALVLADNPKGVEGKVLPEAIHLALRVKSTVDLSDAMRAVLDQGNVSATTASRMLSRLEFQIAP